METLLGDYGSSEDAERLSAQKRIGECSSILVHKQRGRAHYIHQAFTPCDVSSWESEELDEHPHALFLTARKSPGSCEPAQ